MCLLLGHFAVTLLCRLLVCSSDTQENAPPNGYTVAIYTKSHSVHKVRLAYLTNVLCGLNGQTHLVLGISNNGINRLMHSLCVTPDQQDIIHVKQDVLY